MLFLGLFLNFTPDEEMLPSIIYTTITANQSSDATRWIYHNFSGYTQVLTDYDETISYQTFVGSSNGQEVASIDCPFQTDYASSLECQFYRGNYAGHRHLLEEVDTRIYDVAWSPDSTELAFLASAPRGSEGDYIQRIDLNGHLIARYQIEAPSAFYTELSWVDNQIIYGWRNHMFALDIENGESRPLGSVEEFERQNAYRVYSPDYQWIFEIKNNEVTPKLKYLSLFTQDDTFVQNLTPEVEIGRAAWSPDSKWIIFSVEGEDLSNNLYRTTLADATIEQLTDDSRSKSLNVPFTYILIQQNISPDGQWVLFGEYDFNDTGDSFVHAKSIDGEIEIRDLLDGYQGYPHRNSIVTWAPSMQTEPPHANYFIGGGVILILGYGGFTLLNSVYKKHPAK